MGLFSGLRYGRPNYPLYLTDPYKPVEPTALEPLVPSGAREGRKPGATKTGKEILPKGTLAQNIAYNTENYLIKAKERELYSKFLELYEDDPDNWQESKEGKDIQSEMMALSERGVKQKSNFRALEYNLKSIEDEQAKLLAPENKAQHQLVLENKEPVFDEYGVPLTKVRGNKWLYENVGYDERGYAPTLEPFTAVQGDLHQIRLEEMFEDASTAYEEYETDQIITASEAGDLTGKILVQSTTTKNNIKALKSKTVDNFLGDLTPDQEESLLQTFWHKYLNHDQSIYTKVIKDKEYKKGEVLEFMKDENGNFIRERMDYRTYVAFLLANQVSEHADTGISKDFQYLDIPTTGIGGGRDLSDPATYNEVTTNKTWLEENGKEVQFQMFTRNPGVAGGVRGAYDNVMVRAVKAGPIEARIEASAFGEENISGTGRSRKTYWIPKPWAYANVYLGKDNSIGLHGAAINFINARSSYVHSYKGENWLLPSTLTGSTEGEIMNVLDFAPSPPKSPLIGGPKERPGLYEPYKFVPTYTDTYEGKLVLVSEDDIEGQNIMSIVYRDGVPDNVPLTVQEVVDNLKGRKIDTYSNGTFYMVEVLDKTHSGGILSGQKTTSASAQNIKVLNYTRQAAFEAEQQKYDKEKAVRSLQSKVKGPK